MRTRLAFVGIFLIAAILAACGARPPAATGTATPIANADCAPHSDALLRGGGRCL